MVSRDDRRAVALATRRPRVQARTVIRRSVEDEAPAALVEPAELVEPVEPVEKPAPPRIRPPRKRIQRTLPQRKPRLRKKETTSPRQRWTVRLLAVALLGALAAAGAFGRQWYDQLQLVNARQPALAAARQETVDFVS